MCGIAGIWSFRNFVIEIDEIKKMLAIQGHRGPEGAAYCTFDNQSLVLGFLQLGFTDTVSGMQPLFNEDGSIAIVYNGEIYDYRKLRDQLVKLGHHFTTKSDSEVLIHLYEEYGPDFVKMLNGEFAFAIFDNNKQELFLARDPFGVNPLCYAFHNGKFLFSSEAKGILVTDSFPRSLNKKYLNSTGLGVPCASQTLFQGIHNLLPGHSMVVRKDGHEIRKFWQPDFGKTRDTYEEAQENIRFLLDQAVKRRLEGLPPLALSLSSGLDSTIIAAITQKQGFKTAAFSMGFMNRTFDEAQIAKSTSAALGIDHHIAEISYDDLIGNFSKALWHTESPTNSLSNAGRLLNTKNIRASGFKAVMGGESSDELFGGYPFFAIEYIWNMQHQGQKISAALIKTFEKREYLSKRIFWENPKYKEKYRKPYGSAHIAHMRSINAPKFSKILWSSDYSDSTKKVAEDLFLSELVPLELEPLDVFDRSRLMSRNIASSFVFPGLGDRLEMANSLEGRVPFLDADLINYVYALPADYFIDMENLTGKRILKDTYSQMLPQGFSAPPKHTFMAPVFSEIYKLKKGRELFHEYLNPTRIKQDGILNRTTQFFSQVLWQSIWLPKQYGLFVDSLIGLSLSIQILNELFILNHPIEGVDYMNFKLSEMKFSI